MKFLELLLLELNPQLKVSQLPPLCTFCKHYPVPLCQGEGMPGVR